MAGNRKPRKKKDDVTAAATPQDDSQARLPVSKVKVEVPVIPWNQDSSKLVFSLLTAIEKDENRIVLCGKRPGEVRNTFLCNSRSC